MNPVNEPTNEVPSEVQIVVSGDSALVAGSDAAVAMLFERLDVKPSSAKPTGQSAKDLFAGILGIDALASGFDPRWVHMTSESYQRLNELGSFNQLQGGLLSGVIRGDMGRIDQYMKFDALGMNPMIKSNAALLVAVIAVRAAIADLEALVAAMDVKLDQLLEDNRIAALGDIQGLTHVLGRVFNIYQETGRITDTAWSQISGHASALAQAEARARGHVDSLANALAVKSFNDRADAVERAASGELQRWLVILAATHVNQQRLEVLELAHLRQADAEAVAAHAEAARAAVEERRLALTDSVQRLADSLAGAADVSDANRVRSPLKARKLLREAQNTLELVTAYADVASLDIVVGDVERESWRKSLSDLAKGTVAEVRSSAASVPDELSRLREDQVLKKADRIAEKAGRIAEKRALIAAPVDNLSQDPELEKK